MNKNIRVLMIDADETWRNTATQALASKGYDVKVASSCQEALNKMIEYIDVIAVDSKTRRNGGSQFFRSLQGRTANTAIITMSDAGTPACLQGGSTPGTCGHYIKTIDADRLDAIVSEAYGRRSRAA